MKNKKVRTAFSLIEISFVILIIGILIFSISQATDFINESKLRSLQNLTKSSGINSFDSLVAWYETSLDESLDISSRINNAKISTWNDINPNSQVKRNATQTVEANKPTYSDTGIANLPLIRFAGQNFLNMPDGTVPFVNSEYSIFFVLRTDALCTCGILGSGTYQQNSRSNAFRYRENSSNFYNYWWDNDAEWGSMAKINTMQIFSFFYNQSYRQAFVNGIDRGAGAPINRNSTSINNTIGVTNSAEYMRGYIGEIIIFDKFFDENQRKAVESYLSAKWKISLNTW